MSSSSIHQTIKHAISGVTPLREDAFDDFDKLYLKNHRKEIQSMIDLGPTVPVDSSNDEVYQFLSMHRDEVLSRLAESVALDEAYGAWVDRDGKMTIVNTYMGHESVAKKLIGDQFAGDGEASETLGRKGWARVVFDPAHSQLQIDMDKDRSLNPIQKRTIKDYAIENEWEAVLDTFSGSRPI